MNMRSYTFFSSRMSLSSVVRAWSRSTTLAFSIGSGLFRADYARSLSEPLQVNIVQRDRRGSRSGSDRAVRRKPVVRSGQDVLVMGFQSH
jgi:hypothetical protein